ncbi:hypothetical protein ACS0TY_030599 [Phlomoides rotata]
MSCVAWNARGLGGRRAFLLLQQLVVDIKPCMLFISETKVRSSTASRWLSSLNFSGVLGVDPRGSRGGLLLFWGNNINVSLRSYSFSHIDVTVAWESLNWRFTGCYAPSNAGERKPFWDLLRKLNSLKSDLNEKWILGGDFNEIMFPSEKLGGSRKNNSSTQNFLSCLKDIGVTNVKTLGPKFTWTNKRTRNDRVQEKLDRFLANKSWLESFPDVKVYNMGFFGSDHRAIKLSLNHKRWSIKKINKLPFVFENKWTVEDNFYSAALKAWDQATHEAHLSEN